MPREQTGHDKATVRSVDRAFELLGCFSAEQTSLTLTEAARAVELPVSTVSRLLATLEAAQFVRRLQDGRYLPGGRLLRVGVMALHGVELYDAAEEHLIRLAAQTGETSNLAVPFNEETGLYIRQVLSTNSVRHANWIGRPVPISGTAIGAALRGDVDDDGYVFQTATIEPDVTAIAAPVHGSNGQIIAALSVTTPSYRVGENFIEKTGRSVSREARLMSLNLGASTSTKRNGR